MERNTNMRQQLKDGLQSKLNENHNKKREKADMVKYEKQEVSEQVNMFK